MIGLSLYLANSTRVLTSFLKSLWVPTRIKGTDLDPDFLISGIHFSRMFVKDEGDTTEKEKYIFQKLKKKSSNRSIHFNLTNFSCQNSDLNNVLKLPEKQSKNTSVLGYTKGLNVSKSS